MDTALKFAGEEIDPGIQSNERIQNLRFEEYVRLLADVLNLEKHSVNSIRARKV